MGNETTFRDVISIADKIDDRVYRIVSEVAGDKLTHDEVTQIALRVGVVNEYKREQQEQQSFSGQLKTAFAPHKGKIITGLLSAATIIGTALVGVFTRFFDKV